MDFKICRIRKIVKNSFSVVMFFRVPKRLVDDVINAVKDVYVIKVSITTIKLSLKMTDLNGCQFLLMKSRQKGAHFKVCVG